MNSGAAAATKKWGTDGEIVLARRVQSMSLTIMHPSSTELAKKCQSHCNFWRCSELQIGGGGGGLCPLLFRVGGSSPMPPPIELNIHVTAFIVNCVHICKYRS